MNVIKSIKTCYGGHRFRSRLEARWAVFFDACGVDWEYEPEGFVLRSGLKYLPDFLGLWERSARGRHPGNILLRDGRKTLNALGTKMRRMGRDVSGQLISPHSFRHMVATRMLQAGVPLDVVSKILDHSSVAITLKVYAKHSQAQIDAAFDALRDKKKPSEMRALC